MNDRIDRQDSVVNRIIDGSITIDSIEEFEDLLKAFPKDPRLHKVFADRLLEEKPLNAAEEYKISANFFIEADMPLQAIMCKIFEWRIIKPTKEDGLAFHSAISECNPQHIETQKFFTKLSYEEMIALMTQIAPHSYPANTMLRKFGDFQQFNTSDGFNVRFRQFILLKRINLAKKVAFYQICRSFFLDIFICFKAMVIGLFQCSGYDKAQLVFFISKFSQHSIGRIAMRCDLGH